MGATVLYMIKKFMFEFHHKTMKKWFDCRVLYSNTVNFGHEIRTDYFLWIYGGIVLKRCI